LSARTVVEIESHFRDFFSEVHDVIVQAGSWSVSAQGDGTLVAPPVGGEATIIVQGIAPGRRFGLVLLTGGWSVRGLRNLRFRIDDLRDESQNSDFIVELKRRIGCPGWAQEEVLNSAENNKAGRWKRRGEKFKALGRDGKLSGGGAGPWDASAY
jgi:hypothetical protein